MSCTATSATPRQTSTTIVSSATTVARHSQRRAQRARASGAASAHSPTAALVATTTHAKSAWISRNVTALSLPCGGGAAPVDLLDWPR